MPYTRTEYMHGSPPSKISKFTMGEGSTGFTHKVTLVSRAKVQIMHSALEAARVAANKTIAEKLGDRGYSLKVNVYPHVILREHKFLGMAGADRLSEGMRHAFGKAVGRAAIVMEGQKILSIATTPNSVELAKEAMRRASSKLPVSCKIVVEET
jgi:large subunit ribosomal protein L10e